MIRGPILLATAALIAAAHGAHAEMVGKPRIVDGNTIELADRRIGLYGIDAPAEPQICDAQGRAWRCGQDAAFALAAIVETHWVYCGERGRDDGGRIVAVCRLSGPNGPDVGAEMVRQGWARTDRRAAPEYGAAEDSARGAKAGLWRDGGAAPWR